MAIQSNRRKRKHEDATEDQLDDAEVAVPKKVPKESHTPKKMKTKVSKANADLPEENVEQENTAQTDEVEVEKGEPQMEAASPSKKRKPRHQPKVNPEDEKTEHAEISPDSGIEPEEKQQRFPNDFKMMHFRSKLLGNSFITGECPDNLTQL